MSRRPVINVTRYIGLAGCGDKTEELTKQKDYKWESFPSGVSPATE